MNKGLLFSWKGDFHLVLWVCAQSLYSFIQSPLLRVQRARAHLCVIKFTSRWVIEALVRNLIIGRFTQNIWELWNFFHSVHILNILCLPLLDWVAGGLLLQSFKELCVLIHDLDELAVASFAVQRFPLTWLHCLLLNWRQHIVLWA